MVENKNGKHTKQKHTKNKTESRPAHKS